MTVFDPHRVRADFPALSTAGPVWLDSAASSLKLRTVIETVTDWYSGWCGPVGRSIHEAGEAATLALAEARRTLATYVGTDDPEEIIFVGGTTAGINLFARVWDDAGNGRIVSSLLEHHSNLLPWRERAVVRGQGMDLIGLDGRGAIDMSALARALERPAGCVALSLRSNVTGAVLDCARAAELAHQAGAILFVDAAQEAARGPLDLARSGADAAAFSSHKMHGPTGSGVLWVRRELMERMANGDTGGGMALQVDRDGQTWRSGPARFEAGTPHVAGILGMARAADWLACLGRGTITAHEDALGHWLHAALGGIEGVQLHSSGGGVVSFTIDGWHPHDAAEALDRAGFALRAGTLCAQPCMAALGVPALLRASLAVHTTPEECALFADAVRALAAEGSGW